MKIQKWLLIIVLLGLLVNIVFLYFLFFRLREDLQKTISESLKLVRQEFATISSNSEVPLSEEVATDSSFPQTIGCASSCMIEIDSLKKAIAAITPAADSLNSSGLSASLNEPLAKEFIIPFGSGKTQAKDWEDTAGLNAYIDSTNYQRIKSVKFEAAMRIPTANGTVFARLFNKTDGHPVWYSEVSVEGNTSALKQSQNISLDSGNKLYQVQMKTTLGYESLLDSSRIKIVLE